MKKHVKDKDDVIYEGITTFLTEHNFKVFLDDDTGLKIGDSVDIDIMGYQGQADVTGVITGCTSPRSGGPSIYTAEITDFKDSYLEYLQILYDRIPTLPQSLTRDYGAVYHLLRNIAHRILR
jgi:cellulose synthase (UDP-forming)